VTKLFPDELFHADNLKIIRQRGLLCFRATGRVFPAFIAVTLVFPFTLAAQLTTATMSGTVTDPSGAVVAEA